MIAKNGRAVPSMSLAVLWLALAGSGQALAQLPQAVPPQAPQPGSVPPSVSRADAGQAVREPQAASQAGSQAGTHAGIAGTGGTSGIKVELRLVPLSGAPVELGAGDLEKMPHQTLRVSTPSGPEHRMSQAELSGVPLRALLDRMGVPAGHDIRGEALRLYVMAEGADGYRAVLALAEVDPDLAGQTDQIVLVADRRDGHPLDSAEGPLRLVVPTDKRPARWVRQLVRITVLRAP